MDRRGFLIASASMLGSPKGLDYISRALIPSGTRAQLTGYFHAIAGGFLRHAKATSGDYTVCDFPQGTKIKSCLTPSGKTYTSVARMLPALAEYAAAGQPLPVGQPDLRGVLLSIFRTAFDPAHPDYWGEPVGDRPTQRTVESSLVAIALMRLGPSFVAALTTRERANVNRWLASCTKIPERTNNHAWFTAVNQAARLKLSRAFPEFTGDEAWMVADLEAMELLAANAADGWYSDDPKLTVYDYYNFWTFGNFPLFWSRIAGDLYPEWNARLRARSREFLQRVPFFFAADGGVPLFGRSLLYRWALLSPLLLGYEQGLWPHSPGLLRRIVRRNFEWWWRMGAYDETLGKLRETLSPQGAIDVTESYIDNGHPYWAMQAFTFFSIPPDDPFWTAPEEPLPVEKNDFVVKIAGPRMILAGSKTSGQVRWLQARNTPRRDYYRDKYNKFVWSSAFPFNVLQANKDFAPWDQAFVVRDPVTGVCASRIFPDTGELLDDGARTMWRMELRGLAFRVTSTIRLAGDFEYRHHSVAWRPVTAPDAKEERAKPVEFVEGSHALGMEEGEVPHRREGPGWLALHSARSKQLLVSWYGVGYGRVEVAESFDPERRTRVNLVHPRAAVMAFVHPVDALWIGLMDFTTIHYAGLAGADLETLHAQAKTLIDRWGRT